MAPKKEPAKSNVSKDELLHYYREMLQIRRFEEKAGRRRVSVAMLPSNFIMLPLMEVSVKPGEGQIPHLVP